MKKFLITSILAGLLATGTSVMAQNQNDDYLGLPGDNLNLYGVMKLFQESKTLEEFEKNLNAEDSRLNNLDLNGDNLVDYISVYDDIDGNVHNIVMQVAINDKEKQDVAVFTVQRDNNGNVYIQLTGDEELYGKDYIIEPITDDSVAGQTPNPGYSGNARTINGQNVAVVRTTTIEIATWPIVRFIYLPTYSVWRSSWYWGYYPSYWHSWSPFYYHYYYGYHYNWYNDYYGHYRRWNYHRYSRWNDFYYTSHRSHSTYVNININNGRYKTTYSHPEQRKDGEAMYSRVREEQNNRRSENNTNSPNNSQERRSGTVTNSRANTGNSNATPRRSENSVTNRNVSTQPADSKNNTTRRTEQGTTTRSAAEMPSRPKATTERSSVQTRPAETKSQTRSTETRSQTRSTETRSQTRPAEAKSQSRSTESRSQAKPAETRRQESRTSKPAATPAKSSTKAKETDTKKETRRR